MPITRTTLLAGPAAATFGGRTFFAQDGILISPALETDVVNSDANGAIDGSVSGVMVNIQFTPSAPFADLIALYPQLQGAPGASLFGASDLPLVLISANGVRMTFSAVAIIAMPDLFLTTRGPVAGAVTFLAIGARSQGVMTSNRLVTIDTASMPSTPGGTPQLADDFVLTWGAAPWADLRARDGVRIRFALTTKPVISDANALLDLTLERLTVEARFIPASPDGPAEADLINALQLQGALPGRLLSAGARTLTMAGEHLCLELPLAQLTSAELAFDAVRPRVGELTFVAERALVETAAPMATLTEGIPT
jgi:hypothetical protein